MKKDGAATHISPLREPQALVPFTGKERDSETGYSYFGARYYDSDLSGLFLSVDPMADKYPSISLNPTHEAPLREPLALVPYCAWDPLKLVDSDGMEIDDYFSFDGKYLGSDNAKTNNVGIMSEDVWNGRHRDPIAKGSCG